MVFDVQKAKMHVSDGDDKHALWDDAERYRAVVEAFEGLIYVCSADYRIEFANPRLIERTGLNPVGRLCYQALHDRTSACPWCVNQQVLAGETVRWEAQSPKDGRWYLAINAPLRHRDGRVSTMAMI